MYKPERLTAYLPGILRLLWPLLLISGLLIRVVVYFQNRSLFLDEANLARNIAEISFKECFEPLRYQQYAPPFFLLLEKVNWFIAGASEFSLRFWPLIMGCLALLGLYFLLQKLSDGNLTGLFVFYLFAFSQVYIRYSTEVKQYSTDMAVTVGLIWMALYHPPTERKKLLNWVLAGSLAIWLSMPSVFILAGIGCYFLVLTWKKQSVPVSALLLPGVIWLASFGLYYWLILGNDLQKTELLSYHQPYFWPLFPRQAMEWERMMSISQSILGTLIGHTLVAVILGIAGLLAGLLALWKQEKAQICLFLFPVVLCLIASGLGYYSLMQRLTLFMMPLLGLVLAGGLQFLQTRAGHWGKLILAAFCLIVLPLRKGAAYFFSPFRYEEMRPLLAEMDQHLSANDVVWVEQYAEPAFRWYTEYDPLPISLDSTTLIFNSWDGNAAEEISQKVTEEGRIWLVFSHLVSELNRQEMQEDLELIRAQIGELRLEWQFPGVNMWFCHPGGRTTY